MHLLWQIWKCYKRLSDARKLIDLIMDATYNAAKFGLRNTAPFPANGLYVIASAAETARQP